jgi:hypothetical protein
MLRRLARKELICRTTKKLVGAAAAPALGLDVSPVPACQFLYFFVTHVNFSVLLLTRFLLGNNIARAAQQRVHAIFAHFHSNYVHTRRAALRHAPLSVFEFKCLKQQNEVNMTTY